MEYFKLVHGHPIGLRIRFLLADDAAHGAHMDAPESIVIGCVSKRQDIVPRGFDAFTAWVEVCILQGFGRSARLSVFETECEHLGMR